MDGNRPQNRAATTDGSPPPKPWERAGSSSGPVPFKPPAPGKTSDVVEASGTANPGEIVSTSDRNGGANTNALGRPLPSRPWENNYGSNSYGGYSSGLNYNSGYGTGMASTYGQGYGGGLYGGGMYGNSMYRGGYGGLSGSGMLGSGMYNSGIGGTMGGYGMGTGMGMGMGGPYGPQDPNDPYGEPASPPGFCISLLRVMQGVVNFFGRISMLVDQNTQAIHMFMSALLQLFDRSGMLYGELARFAMRILGIKTKARKVQPPAGPNNTPLPGSQTQALNAPKAASGGSWDNVWGGETTKRG